jgi:hypothetical protein
MAQQAGRRRKCRIVKGMRASPFGDRDFFDVHGFVFGVLVDHLLCDHCLPQATFHRV